MSNEQLAILIRQGHTEYYTELWEQTRRLIYKLIYQAARGRKLPHGVDMDDVLQCGYFALCGAVKAYKPDEGYKFSSYLSFQIKHAVNAAIGRGNKVAAFIEVSYNEPIKGKNGSDDAQLIDLIEDENAALSFEQLELTDTQEKVWQAVAALPDKEREAITEHFLRGRTYKEIAKESGVTVAAVHSRVRQGLTLLRRSQSLRALYADFTRHYSGEFVLGQRREWRWRISPELHAVLKDIAQRRENGEYISYGKEQAAIYKAEHRSG